MNKKLRRQKNKKIKEGGEYVKTIREDKRMRPMSSSTKLLLREGKTETPYNT
jgi:hypothetical protein